MTAAPGAPADSIAAAMRMRNPSAGLWGSAGGPGPEEDLRRGEHGSGEEDAQDASHLSADEEGDDDERGVEVELVAENGRHEELALEDVHEGEGEEKPEGIGEGAGEADDDDDGNGADEGADDGDGAGEAGDEPEEEIELDAKQAQSYGDDHEGYQAEDHLGLDVALQNIVGLIECVLGGAKVALGDEEEDLAADAGAVGEEVEGEDGEEKELDDKPCAMEGHAQGLGGGAGERG